jgi:hypothetical protein
MTRITLRTISSLAFLLLLTGCSSHRPTESDLFNAQAALPADAPVPALQWKAISSSIDRQSGAMSTLTGNDLAVQAARTGDSHYPAGAVLALVTWAERPDPHWFGAKIAAQFQSIETISVTQDSGGSLLLAYKKYAGQPIKEVVNIDSSSSAVRKTYILAQRASVMP